MSMCQKNFLYNKPLFLDKISELYLFRMSDTTWVYKESPALWAVQYISIFRKWIKCKLL